MPLVDVERQHNPVMSEATVRFSLDAGEATELKDALAVVRRYERAALKAVTDRLGYDPAMSDWHSISFQVRAGRVVVSITDGMTG
jgi:hypothetical protein